ncbi:hypothetical protein DPEC_G00047110 [Dallia pectoralis]|uniref:Uncharacterized protein n=1 Tax=Dallia pectoralis TaxID=75939 RepID=A0ACC2HAS4_DALPE|nr:hypothetical protein DPEC_G00047110 [Dallia pectoralis]
MFRLHQGSHDHVRRMFSRLEAASQRDAVWVGYESRVFEVTFHAGCSGGAEEAQVPLTIKATLPPLVVCERREGPSRELISLPHSPLLDSLLRLD